MTFDASHMLAFDLETTSANPKEARIVTSALVRIDGRDVQKVEHLADPGIEIPQEATSVHGITTEKARAEGRPHDEVLDESVAAIRKGVHLLRHHVGGLAHAAGEKRGVFENGQLNVLEAGEMCLLHHGLAHLIECGRLRWEIVWDTFRSGQGLKLLFITHGYYSTSLNVAKKGLVALSLRIVVVGPWPGRMSRLSGRLHTGPASDFCIALGSE